ncbi:MAG: hypothetical protein R2747_19090 [Pyrinomonadaceae bacterium]
MMNKSKMTRFLIISFAAVGFVLVSGSFSETKAQRDPFKMPGYAKPRPAKTSSNPADRDSSPTPDKPKGPMVVPAPSIEQRINYYKMMREQAALNGLPIPKVTSVLTLSEMSVTGIFRTPRGYAAMVEAKPINLSYTIYPGEKFFDGQLVAVEENRLVFRKVTKMSNNKFISSVENKTLRQYSVQEEVQGTAPVRSSGSVETARQSEPAQKTESAPAPPAMIISPLDEMNNQPAEDEKDAKKGKKPVKVAKGKKH